MKSNLLIVVLVLLVAFTLPLVAQEKQMDITVKVDEDTHGLKKIFIKKVGGVALDLTDAQKEKIEDLKLDHQKELLLLQNDLRVKKLDLKIATKNPDKVNLGQVNAIVDGIHKLNASVQKKDIAHNAKFRSLLTDEQKKNLDACCGMDGNVHVIRRQMILGHGGNEMMWCGDAACETACEADCDVEMLHNFDIDIDVEECEQGHGGNKKMKRIEIKKKM
jgi:hypothetical protein